MFLPLMALLAASSALANHPVLVEGNSDSPVVGTTIVNPPGSSGDWDGDGRISLAEDTDGADRIFGTINAAMGPGTGAAAATGANSNGTVTIVASGRFAEIVTIPATTGMAFNFGNVTLEAAPGVAAILDAVLQGRPTAENTARQNAVGITIKEPEDRLVILRNLIIRNFAEGVQIKGPSRVLIENCVFENNRDYGIHVLDTARVTILNCRVLGTGRRTPATGTVSDGNGIDFATDTKGQVIDTTVMSSVGTGLIGPAAVIQNNNTLAFNGVNQTQIP
jgi:parallel beta-helix repeat protein